MSYGDNDKANDDNDEHCDNNSNKNDKFNIDKHKQQGHCTVKSLLIEQTGLRIEQGLTSHRTHYRSYWGQVFTGQMT